ncbi:pre-peptidase C-terminal domain-containing protein [Bacillus sp. Marseille-P3661]|uniref:pre-peptidase C-terminal domain-containing protein n=1 Tax=Bacillus sp. Marseille-P3661 TaxID=1936234 RepID=UPI000C844C1B|nr:pre-peptidase C-terminal domain-containing protein [Bacillus sp. Marseille-P3661]
MLKSIKIGKFSLKLLVLLVFSFFLVSSSSFASSEVTIMASKEPSMLSLDDWTQTDAYVNVGDQISLTVSGSITYGLEGDLGFSPLVNADGTRSNPDNNSETFEPKYDSNAFYPQFPVGSLVGVIALGNSISDPFLVTTDTYTSQSEGYLVLTVNDAIGSYEDNTGSFSIIIDLIPENQEDPVDPSDPENPGDSEDPTPTITAMVSGHLDDFNPEDWYKVELQEDGAIKFDITTDSTNSNSNWNLTFYDSDQTTALNSTGGWFYDTSVKTTGHDHLKAGTYYVQVYRVNGFGSYSLTPTLTPLTDKDPELNDSADLAITMVDQENYRGYLGYTSLGDSDLEDWYKVTLNEDGELRINVTTESPNSNSYWSLNLFDVDRQTILSGTGGWFYDPSLKWAVHNHLKAGTYYVQIKADAGYGAYTISPTVTTLPDKDLEPNDTLENAITMISSGNYKGYLGYSSLGDVDLEDWYKIELNGDGELQFSVSSQSPDSNSNWSAHLYDADKNTLITSSGGWFYDTSPKLFGHNHLKAGTYYVQLKRDAGYGSYILTPTATPLTDNDEEINDSAVEALLMTQNQVYKGYLGYTSSGITDSDDWYKIQLDEDSNLQMTVTTGSPDGNSNWTANLYDPNLQSIINFTGGWFYDPSPKTFGHTHLKAGTYYVQLKLNAGYGTYTLSPSVTPLADNDLEVNDNAESAIPMGPNQSYQGYLGNTDAHSTDTEDWYVLNIAEGSDLTLNITSGSLDGNAYLNLILYEQDKTTAIANVGQYFNGGNQTVEKNLLPAGIYYAKVMLHSGYGSYKLTGTFMQGQIVDPELETDINGDGLVDIYDIVEVAKAKSNLLKQIIQDYGK